MNSEAIITLKSREKIALARKDGIAIPAVVRIGVGDGGIDSSGNVIFPTEHDTSLKNPLLCRNYNSVTQISSTSYRYRIDIKKGELTNKKISELAIFDSEGDLVAIKTFHPQEISEDMEVAFEIEDRF